MKFQKNISLTLSLLSLVLVSHSLQAENCSSPCDVTVTSGFGNGVLRIISDLPPAGDWEIKSAGTNFTGTSGNSLVFGKVGDTTPPVAISGDASSNTLAVGPNGNVGINTLDASEELTIDSFRPAIRLNDTTSGSVDFNLVADGSSFAVEDSDV